jgi:probable rRNA maturation factor
VQGVKVKAEVDLDESIYENCGESIRGNFEVIAQKICDFLADSGYIDVQICCQCSTFYVYILFTDNKNIRIVNSSTRNIDSSTDVLSFPLLNLKNGAGTVSELDMDPDSAQIILGDIIISVDKIFQQSQEYGHSFEREAAFLVCHGLLHLCGYDHVDPEDERIMFGIQDDLLANAGYTT